MTGGGVTLGTVGYMSPEQVRGEALDARTDLFSLGVVLYEMATGMQPFRGATSGVVLGEILEKAPTAPVSSIPTFRRPRADRQQAAGEGPRLRYQSAADLCVDLERLGRELANPPAPSSAWRAPRPSVSRRPPVREPQLRTRTRRTSATASPRRSSRRCRSCGPAGDFAQLGDDAERREEDHGRDCAVAQRQPRARRQRAESREQPAHHGAADRRATDAHLWAERYAGTLDDIFDIQEQVARAISDALKVALSPDEDRQMAARAVTDVRAYECCQRARHDLRLMTRDGWERGLRMLQQGLGVFADNSVLHAGIAQAHLHALEADLEPREGGLAAVRAAVARVGDHGAEAMLTSRAWLERLDGNHVRSMRFFEEAVLHDPADTDALFWLSLSYLGVGGKTAAGMATANRLVDVDPLTISNGFVRGLGFGVNGDWARALAVYDDMLRREPGLRFLTLNRMLSLAWLGRTADACRVADETIAQDPGDMFGRAVAALKQALLGQAAPVLDFANGPLRPYLWNDAEWPWWLAGWLTLVHEHDQAYVWLDRWLERGAINYPMLARIDPFFEPLRGDLRFQRLLDRVKPEWERFEPRFGPQSWNPVTPVPAVR